MRTRTLLLAAALSTAGLATSLAQSNVYSLNVVGYVNVPIKTGLNLIANPLDLDGTGNSNTVFTSVGTANVPALSKIYAWNPTGGTGFGAYRTLSFAANNWLGDTAGAQPNFNPGSGFFFESKVDTNITFVGNVLQGTLTTPIQGNAAGAYLQQVSSKVPQEGGITSVLGYPKQPLDKVFVWNTTKLPAPGYDTYSSLAGATWLPSEPVLAVGQSVFAQARGATNWVRTFTVQ